MYYPTWNLLVYLILTNSFANFCLSPLAAHVRYQDGHRSTFNCRPFNSDLNLCWLYCIFDLTFDKNAVCALGGASLYNLPMICWIQGAPANQKATLKVHIKSSDEEPLSPPKGIWISLDSLWRCDHERVTCIPPLFSPSPLSFLLLLLFCAENWFLPDVCFFGE